jgi:hypothetical protein
MWRKSGKTNADKPVGSAARVNPWHAVSVLTGPDSCGPARSLGAVRFLSTEAPRLPLSQCPTPALCRCGYKHYDDRRLQARRREDRTGYRPHYDSSQERRGQQDRRSTD